MSQTEYEQLRQQIHKRIRWSPFSHAQIAEDLGVHPSYVSQVIGGHRRAEPTLRRIGGWIDGRRDQAPDWENRVIGKMV